MAGNVQLFIMQDGELKGTYLNGEFQPKADLDREQVAYAVFRLLHELMQKPLKMSYTGGLGLGRIDDIDGGTP